MPTMRINGANLHYEARGSGPETIVFQHGILMDSRMFDSQVGALSARYRCITYDARGHGRSEVTRGGYDLQALARDAAALIRSLDCAPCHLVGANVGGCVALNVAILEPGLLRSLALLNASASDWTRWERLQFTALTTLVRTVGMRPVSGWMMRTAFGREFRRDPARRAELERWRDHVARQDKGAVSRILTGLGRGWDWLERIPEITVPTLVVAGPHDPETVRVAAQIPGARLEQLSTTGFASPIEAPAEVTRLLATFFDSLVARPHLDELPAPPPLH